MPAAVARPEYGVVARSRERLPKAPAGRSDTLGASPADGAYFFPRRQEALSTGNSSCDHGPLDPGQHESPRCAVPPEALSPGGTDATSRILRHVGLGPVSRARYDVARLRRPEGAMLIDAGQPDPEAPAAPASTRTRCRRRHHAHPPDPRYGLPALIQPVVCSERQAPLTSMPPEHVDPLVTCCPCSTRLERPGCSPSPCARPRSPRGAHAFDWARWPAELERGRWMNRIGGWTWGGGRTASVQACFY